MRLQNQNWFYGARGPRLHKIRIVKVNGLNGCGTGKTRSGWASLILWVLWVQSILMKKFLKPTTFIQYFKKEEVRKWENCSAETGWQHCVIPLLFLIWKTETQSFQQWDLFWIWKTETQTFQQWDPRRSNLPPYKLRVVLFWKCKRPPKLFWQRQAILLPYYVFGSNKPPKPECMIQAWVLIFHTLLCHSPSKLWDSGGYIFLYSISFTLRTMWTFRSGVLLWCILSPWGQGESLGTEGLG